MAQSNKWYQAKATQTVLSGVSSLLVFSCVVLTKIENVTSLKGDIDGKCALQHSMFAVFFFLNLYIFQPVFYYNFQTLASLKAFKTVYFYLQYITSLCTSSTAGPVTIWRMHQQKCIDSVNRKLWVIRKWSSKQKTGCRGATLMWFHGFFLWTVGLPHS